VFDGESRRAKILLAVGLLTALFLWLFMQAVGGLIGSDGTAGPDLSGDLIGAARNTVSTTTSPNLGTCNTSRADSAELFKRLRAIPGLASGSFIRSCRRNAVPRPDGLSGPSCGWRSHPGQTVRRRVVSIAGAHYPSGWHLPGERKRLYDLSYSSGLAVDVDPGQPSRQAARDLVCDGVQPRSKFPRWDFPITLLTDKNHLIAN
jgi:hypothetical protein